MSYIEFAKADDQNRAGVIIGSRRYSWLQILVLLIVLLIIAMILQRFGYIHNKRVAVVNNKVSGVVDSLTPTPRQ
jgi:hypothetical protein